MFVNTKKYKKSWRVIHCPQPSREELAFTSQGVEAFWSKVAREHYKGANLSFKNTHQQRYQVSLPVLDVPADGKLLNIWSRQGGAITGIRKRFPNVELVNAEISGVMLSQAREQFPDELFIATDLLSIDCPDNYFDAILSLEMLEHSPSPQNILCEIYRVLKPKGQVVLTCPSLFSEVHLWFADHFMNNHGEGPHKFPAISQVKKMLKSAGFRLANQRATLFIPKELGSIHRLDRLCEKYFQFFPFNELGLRQVYEAYKP